jgi:hypothetical protein
MYQVLGHMILIRFLIKLKVKNSGWLKETNLIKLIAHHHQILIKLYYKYFQNTSIISVKYKILYKQN